MYPATNIVLIGLRGTGKTHISRLLSLRTHRPVVSTDHLISYEYGGLTIAEILKDLRGDWRRFRELELMVVEKAARMREVIVDTGGGVVVDLDGACHGQEIFSEQKIGMLKRSGWLVWLQGDIDRLAKKVSRDVTRPSLSALHTERDVMAHRLPFYQKAADWSIDIEKNSRETASEKILERFSWI